VLINDIQQRKSREQKYPNVADFEISQRREGRQCAGEFGRDVIGLFRARERGLELAVWVVWPFLGPVLGPLVRGFIGQYGGLVVG